MYIRSLPPMLPIQYGSLSARTLPLTVLIIVSMNNIQLFFFFKQKTAYEMELWTGVQTCALPISLAGPIHELIVTSNLGLRSWIAAARSMGRSDELIGRLKSARLLASTPLAADSLRGFGLDRKSVV